MLATKLVKRTKSLIRSYLLITGAGIHKYKSLVYGLIVVIYTLSFAVPSLLWLQKAQASINLNGNPAPVSVVNGTQLQFTKPAGAVEGDYMLISINISNTTEVITAPSGGSAGTWTSVLTTTGTGQRMHTWRHVVGTEAGPYTFTWTNSRSAVGGLLNYTGVETTGDNGANGIDASGGSRSSSGTGLVTENNVTTVASNTLVVPIFGQAVTTLAGNITLTTVDTNRFSGSTSCGLNCLNVALAAADVAGPAGGTLTGAKSGSSNVSGAWVAHLVVLKNATPPAYSVGAYRWFSNVDSADLVGTTNNVTAGDDQVTATAVDPTNGRIYLAGYDNGGASNTQPRWRIEKRVASTGSLDLTFNSTGIITEDVASSTDEKINAMALDLTNGFMYVVGYDKAGGNSSQQWRMQKRSLSDGAISWTQTSDPGTAAAADDRATSIAIDVSGGSIYVAGRDSGNSGQWRIEKRNLSNGNYDSTFNSNTGFLTYNPSPGQTKDEYINAIVLDIANGYMFVNGFDGSPSGANSSTWRVERRSMSTGALVSGFGNHDSTNCDTITGGTTGVYCVDPNGGGGSDDRGLSLAIDSTYLFISGIDTSGTGGQWRVDRITLANNVTIAPLFTLLNYTAGDDTVTSMVSDGTNLYLGGYDGGESPATTREWRYEKRSVAGVLVVAFNTTGAVKNDPTAGTDSMNAMAVDTTNGFIYGVGYDSTGANEWRLERRSATTGAAAYTPTALGASQDAVYSATPQQVVRLRMLLHVSLADFYPSLNQQFKLKIAPKSGTCDTGYVNEVFTDVSSSSGAVRYFDNTSITDASATQTFPNDPVHASEAKTLQTFEESNNFTNRSGIAINTDGVWDFALSDNDVPPSAFGAYCFKVTTSADVDVAVPTQVPELTYCGRPNTASRLRHTKYFCDEKLKRFYWSTNT